MLNPGDTVVVNVTESVLSPRWLQNVSSPGEGHALDIAFRLNERTFIIKAARDGSNDKYAWYDTDKGTLVVHEHSEVEVL